MDKRNEIELLQAQLIQERALVQDLEAGKSKMILDAIEVGGQFLDLCEAVRVLKEVLQFVMLKAPGYDWNTDPLSITLMVGNALTKSNHVLAGEPDEENDSLQDQLTQRTAELEAAKAIQAIDMKNNNAYREQVANLQAELERVRADNKALDKWRADVTVALQRPEGAFFVDVPQHIKDLVKERDDLRTLVLALPKVEGDWTVSCALADRVVEGGIVSDISEAVAAIVQHRQGMEG